MCPCGKAVEIKTHIVGAYEICKEERDVLQMRKLDCNMDKFGTLDININRSEKTIALLGDKWPQESKQEVDTKERQAKEVLCNM